MTNEEKSTILGNMVVELFGEEAHFVCAVLGEQMHFVCSMQERENVLYFLEHATTTIRDNEPLEEGVHEV